MEQPILAKKSEKGTGENKKPRNLWPWLVGIMVLLITVTATLAIILITNAAEKQSRNKEHEDAVSTYEASYSKFVEMRDGIFLSDDKILELISDSNLYKKLQNTELSDDDKEQFLDSFTSDCYSQFQLSKYAKYEKVDAIESYPAETIKKYTSSLDEYMKELEETDFSYKKCLENTDELIKEIDTKIAERKAEREEKEKAAAEAAKEAARQAEIDSATASQRNALKKAESYLEYSAFSRKGLISQLEYEQFSKSDSTWAVDHVDVDWNEQAAKKAESYLEYSSFSKKGLISQLLYEGFTQKQAEYGVNKSYR